MSLYGKSTPLCIAVKFGRFSVLSCLVVNGADVNARTSEFSKRIPLIVACGSCSNLREDLVTFLVQHGADINVQDESGNTALHCAIQYQNYDLRCRNQLKVINKLLTLGASLELQDKNGLTPLLLAINECKVSVVEDLIKRPECTKEQRIEALELLAASFLTMKDYSQLNEMDKTLLSFHYMKRGMVERFQDPSNPLLKQPMKSVEAYQKRESNSCGTCSDRR